MTRRLTGLAAAAVLAAGIVVTSGTSGTALAGNSWDHAGSGTHAPGNSWGNAGLGNSWG